MGDLVEGGKMGQHRIIEVIDLSVDEREQIEALIERAREADGYLHVEVRSAVDAFEPEALRRVHGG